MEKPFTDPQAGTQEVADNLQRIREHIAHTCASCGRREEDVTLMGVTKTVEAARINRAIAEGLTCIGENRVQEYLGKRDALQLKGVQTHLIGHLQTNKAKSITPLVDGIDSIDSLRVAQAVEAACVRAGRTMEVLVEVNIGGEASKSGVAPDQLDTLLSQIAMLSHLQVRGLMTIPPISTLESEKRAFFAAMCKLFIDIQGKNRDNICMDVLSMGMSSDYVQAIQEGATMVRIGSALFGSRRYAQA